MVSCAPEDCSCSSLRQASRHISRYYDDALAPAGISLNQYSMLAKLDRLNEAMMQDLADALVMDRSTVGHLLRPLEKRGLITMQPSTDDRRQRVVKLTRQGVRILAKARPLWAEAESSFQHHFGVANAAGLRAMMLQVTSTHLQA